MSDNKQPQTTMEGKTQEWQGATVKWYTCFFKLKKADPQSSDYDGLKRDLEQAWLDLVEASNNLNNAKERTQEKK